MSDGSDDFLKQAQREGQILREQGVRTDAHVSAESLMQRNPPVTPNTNKLYPGRQTYAPDNHPTDRPVTPVTESDLRKSVQAAQDAFPTDSNQPNMLRPGVNQGHWSQTQIPSPEETRVEVAMRQPVSLNNQATLSDKLDHSPQHDAQQDSVKARQPVSMQAGTPAEAQKQGEQEAGRAKVLANRETSQAVSDQAVSRAAATEKAAEQAKVQQQTPPTQDR